MLASNVSLEASLIATLQSIHFFLQRLFFKPTTKDSASNHSTIIPALFLITIHTLLLSTIQIYLAQPASSFISSNRAR